MIRLKLHYTCILAVAIGVASCSHGQEKTHTASADTTAVYKIGDPKAIPEKEVQRIKNSTQAFYDTVFRNGVFNGGIIVAEGGNIIFEKYTGSVNLDGKDSVNEHTPMHVASVSKTFTAMEILKLQEQGKLNIDDPVSKYITGFNYPGVTIKTLLDHRSGLPNYNHFFEKTKTKVNKDSFLTNNDVVRFLIDHKNELTNIGVPDRGFNYCNTNYALLATIIENISGKPFPQFMQDNVFGPVGLKNTFIRYKGDGRSVAKSFDWRGREIADNYLDMVYGDKNVYTTPRDLLTWDRALSDTVFLSAKSLEAAYTPYSNEKTGIKNYGLGWHMNIYPDGKKLIFHNGWWHGSNAAFIRPFKEDATIIMIGNRYTRNIYKAKNLVNLFDHYFDADMPEDSEGAAPATDSVVTKKPVVKKVATKKVRVPKAAAKKTTTNTKLKAATRKKGKKD